MNVLYVDFETYYAADYSLSKMQTDAYVKDNRFEVIGVSVAVNDGSPVWYSADSMLEYAGYLKANYDWENSAVCCHNTLFDGFILAHHFGIKPMLWMDTLAMSRMVWPYLPSHSLANIARHCKLADKGSEVTNAMGLTKAQMSPAFLLSYAHYCIHDTELCRDIALRTQPLVPGVELLQIDMIIRMFTQPQFHGDVSLLKQQYATEVERKRELLEKAELQKDTIMSNEKFAEHLRNLGVTPPTKVSAKTGKVAYAFAKTDKEFQALLDYDNDEVVAAVSARLGVKTTIAETRVLRMVEMAERGPLPVYLNFWGAKTTGRLSGGNQMNWQNMPARGVSAGIRKGIIAPEGYKILVGDSSNIELRVAMAAAGQDDVVHKLASGIDLYCDFASKLFGRVVTKADKKERMLGKIAMLSLQYGAGWVKFKEMVRIQSGDVLPDDTAKRIVDLYRAVHGNVMDLHRYCGDVILPDIAQGCGLLPVDRHAWAITSNEGYGVAAQQGVKYHNLRQELMMRDGRQEMTWVYTMGREKVKIYGGKCVDGDALVLTEAGWRPLRLVGDLRVHDGVDFVRHGGIAYKGFKPCVTLDGVLMTPDHKVLTEEGWQDASQSTRLYRPDLRGTVGDTTQPHGRKENTLAFSVYLRETRSKGRHRRDQGSEARRDAELRVHDQGPYIQGAYATRHEQTPSVCSVEVHAGPVSAAYASGVEKLRGAWHHCVHALAGVVREFLGGHGADVPSWAYAGPAGQRQGVWSGELRVADVLRTGEQQKRERHAGYTVGAYDALAGGREGGDQAYDAVVPTGEGVAAGSGVLPGMDVYDIVNCGPRNRFVVLGENGPFVAHNCVENLCQYLAGRIVMWQTARFNKRYPVALSVHDEVVCVVRDDQVAEAQAYLEECLSLAPPWCRGNIPLACETDFGQSYGDAK